MSIASDFVEKLRDKAFMQTANGIYKLLDEAADVIEELSDKLLSYEGDLSNE